MPRRTSSCVHTRRALLPPPASPVGSAKGQAASPDVEARDGADAPDVRHERYAREDVEEELERRVLEVLLDLQLHERHHAEPGENGGHGPHRAEVLLMQLELLLLEPDGVLPDVALQQELIGGEHGDRPS